MRALAASQSGEREHPWHVPRLHAVVTIVWTPRRNDSGYEDVRWGRRDDGVASAEKIGGGEWVEEEPWRHMGGRRNGSDARRRNLWRRLAGSGEKGRGKERIRDGQGR